MSNTPKNSIEIPNLKPRVGNYRDQYPHYPYKIIDGSFANQPFAIAEAVSNIIVGYADTEELACVWIKKRLDESLKVFNEKDVTREQPKDLQSRLYQLDKLLRQSIIETNLNEDFDALMDALIVTTKWLMYSERNSHALNLSKELSDLGIKMRPSKTHSEQN